MAISAAGIAAAIGAEINSCSFNADAGTRIKSRPHQFCDSVTIQSTLDVASTATFAVPIDVTEAVIVDGIPYMPAAITGLGASGTILTANGVSINLVAPTPPPATFHDVTITGSLTIDGEAVFNAGTY